MKRTLTFALVCWVTQFGSWAAPARGFSPTLYPGQNGKIILNISCTAESKLTWTSEIKTALKGLKKGDQVLAITQNGLVPATVGDLECLLGGCRENYVGVDLVVDNENDVLGVMNAGGMRAPKNFPIKPVTVDRKQCQHLYPGITNSRFPEVGSKRDCRKVVFPGGIELLLAKKGFQQENDWIAYTVKGQILRAGKTGASKGPVFDLDEDVEPLEPILGFIDNKEVSVLWRKATGIGGPQAVTVQWSRLKESGTLAFGEPHTAGGQPCD